jgi:phosphomannomutase
MTPYELGCAFGQNVARGRTVTVSRDADPVSAQFAGGFISGLMSTGAAVEYLAAVSNLAARSAGRSAETSAHVHVRGHSMTVRL